MKKEKFHIEFVMGSATQGSLWRMISQIDGLSEWFADSVDMDEQDQTYTFTWNQSPSVAHVLHSKPQSSIRMQWQDDDRDTYFELALYKLELTGGMVLEITDFADCDEKADAISLWESQVEVLKRKLGV